MHVSVGSAWGSHFDGYLAMFFHAGFDRRCASCIIAILKDRHCVPAVVLYELPFPPDAWSK